MRSGALDLAHGHVDRLGAVLHRDRGGVGAQVVHPDRVLRRAAHRPDQRVLAVVLDAHEGQLADLAGLVAARRDDDDRLPGVAQRVVLLARRWPRSARPACAPSPRCSARTHPPTAWKHATEARAEPLPSPAWSSDRLRLRPVRVEDEAVVRAAHETMAAEGFVFALALGDDDTFADYVARLERIERGEPPMGRYVESTFLLAEVDGEVVGRTSIRHRLNDFLLHEGGHIGYCVLPPHRRRGYATEILRQSLERVHALGVDRCSSPATTTTSAARR